MNATSTVERLRVTGGDGSTAQLVGAVNPPVAAAMFAVDEKPQIQALNRTAPTLPMLPTTPARATHDYERNGTCDLFAALEIATGKVITDIRARATPPRTSSADSGDFVRAVRGFRTRVCRRSRSGRR